MLTALTDEVLEAASALFGVRREWLEGASERIYPLRHCYKSPHRFFEELRSLAPPAMILPVRAFTTDKHLDYRKWGSQRLELVLVERAGWLGDDEEIERYRPFSDGWEWGYERTRLELKAIVANYGHPVPLFQVSRKAMDALYSGEIFPRALLQGPLCTDPSLEDYCMPVSQNRQARETEELEEVAVYRKAIDAEPPSLLSRSQLQNGKRTEEVKSG
ncbi:hypothetical protein DEO45_08875 [Rhodanobacter denitrificans]|uniref:Uncharacterized protein n=2 Tax=Rhodanobacter denitrificans TaxID=666685 RepID=A0A368KHJ4_9GAMM|nr:hypothetical protein DEO45_08875 [Rhodanobacter denitrificans]